MSENNIKTKIAGCKTSIGCKPASCYRKHTYNWLSDLGIEDVEPFNIVEVSFKQGARKAFYTNAPSTRALTGDYVVVEAANGGKDIGRITLSGELVRIQLKKKKVKSYKDLPRVIRVADDRDMSFLREARDMEQGTLVKARVIARKLGIDMKIGDIEYQGDKRKVIIYYTAEGRVDFRELIKHYASEFKVRIEMRQIGSRQESARIGGLGSCGRELCCSTWLSEFKSVVISAARYQNLALNQAKLSGHCSRLKCCLNYELDSYLEALEEFPTKADRLKTAIGIAKLIKTDVFKKTMYYVYEAKTSKNKVYAVLIDRVKIILAMNKKNQFPADLIDIKDLIVQEESEIGFETVNDVIELPMKQKKKKRKWTKRRRSSSKRTPRKRK